MPRPMAYLDHSLHTLALGDWPYPDKFCRIFVQPCSTYLGVFHLDGAHRKIQRHLVWNGSWKNRHTSVYFG